MGKRIAAAVLAVAMIGGALWFRSRDTSTSANPSTPSAAMTSVICPPDLVTMCRNAAANTGVTVEQQDVTETINETFNATNNGTGSGAAEPAAWVTLTPLPAAATFGGSIILTETPIASSPLSLIVLNDRSPALTTACGNPVDWVCLGRSAGAPWTELGGEAAWGRARPGLSPAGTAIGALSVASAVTAYFDGRSIDATDVAFISWARQFARAVPPSSLSAGTAVETIQVRSSTLDIAAGSSAELLPTNADRFDNLPIGNEIDATVVLATTDGAKVDDAFVEALRSELTNNGWVAASGSPPTLAFGGGDVRAALTAWEDMQ